MRQTLILMICVLLPVGCYSQVDSSYIGSYEQKLSISPYLARDMLMLNVESGGIEKSYIPNNPPNIGLGITIKNTIIGFSYGYGADFMRDKKYGKTKSLDFQIHNYGQKIALDLFIQQYKGFYDDEHGGLDLYPDLDIHQYGLSGQYVLNNKRFSYKAAFDQNEKQLKSAGSILAGAGVYLTKITSDSSFVYNGKNTFDNFQFGISAGYAYTWVLGRHWTINASGTVGINFGSEKVSSFGKQKPEVYPTVFPRLSAGYDRDSWALGFSYVGNVTFPSLSDDSSITILSGAVQFSYTKRFDNIPFLKKKR